MKTPKARVVERKDENGDHFGSVGGMLTPEDFNEMADALGAANGIDRALADNYVFLIGDTPELDEQGKFIVRDENGNELARLIAPDEW